MTLDDVFKIIDRLTPEQRQKVSQYIERQRQDALRREIDAIIEAAEPTVLVTGTMDMDQLLRAAQAMWEGLSEEEIAEIAQIMNEEFIEPDGTRDE
jgi:phosphoserine phosphatase